MATTRRASARNSDVEDAHRLWVMMGYLIMLLMFLGGIVCGWYWHIIYTYLTANGII